jgi:metal-responsive CopG/Arc/MetJ family transcriptional regulator
MSEEKKTLLKGESNKDKFIYIRVEEDLLQKIDELKTKRDFKNRSQTVRSMIVWAFENGVDVA